MRKLPDLEGSTVNPARSANHGADAGWLSSATGLTVADLLMAGARRHPDRTLLVYERPDGTVETFTWKSVLGRAAWFAARLDAAGIRPGERVHLHLGNRPEFLVVWFAAALHGATIVPTNTACSVDELAYIVAHAETRLTVTESHSAEHVKSALARAERGGEIWCCDRDELAGEAQVAPRSDSATPEKELGIIYTSGTTSRPKGVIVTHANYVYAGEVVAKGFALSPDDRLIAALPLYHANAQYYSTMGALHAGATLVLLPRFSATRFIDQCIAHRATVASLFAAPIRMILAQEPSAAWLHNELRVVLFAQNLSERELDLWHRRVGAPLLQLYGMTETIGPPLMNPVWGPRNPHKLGRVSLGYTCRVVREDGFDAEYDEPGELWVRGIPGTTLTPGYLHDPAATAAALADGWLRTGDIVRVDRRGYFTFVDRRKDMIKRSGENVAASEVEAVLGEHPAVSDVAVVGVTDRIRDEAIVAFVVAAKPVSARDLTVWCSARLAKFRVPSEFVFRRELPRTSVGKVQKRLLRAEFEAGLARLVPCPDGAQESAR
jgi:carnitine-CoA ligase